MSTCPASPARTSRRRLHPEHRWTPTEPLPPVHACQPTAPADRPDLACTLAWCAVALVALVVAVAVGRLVVTVAHAAADHRAALSTTKLAPVEPTRPSPCWPAHAAVCHLPVDA